MLLHDGRKGGGVVFGILILVSEIMNSSDYFVNFQLVLFTSSCVEMRETLISMNS